MMEGSDLEQRIEQLVNQKIQAQLETVQLAMLRKEFLTREEFLAAMQKMDKRFEDLLTEMNKRFEAVDKRFEAVDRRFEAVDRRFEAVDKRFDALIAEMHHGFEENRLMFVQLKAAIDNLGAQSGESLQQAILELMNSLIVKAGVDYKQVQRKTLVDAGSDVFFPGYSTDVDVVARDGEVHLFEVKYKADQRDFAHFLKVAKLYEMVEKVRPGKLFLITLEISQKTLRAIAHLPVEIIAGSVAL